MSDLGQGECSDEAMKLRDSASDVVVTWRARLTADAFDVPCVPIDDLVEVASQFGASIPERMRGATKVSEHKGGLARLARVAESLDA